MGVLAHAHAAWRFATFLVVSLGFALVFTLAISLSRRLQLRVQRRWCAAVAWAAALDVRAEGRPVTGPGTVLYLVNHVSYFDIPAVGGALDAAFVAKSEVASWPLFGWFSRLTGTVFIPRQPTRSAAQVETLRRRFARGENLILFPEGTNSDGSDVLPFKSSLLASVEGAPVRVQPVSLAYVRTRDGRPLTGARRGLYAWVGEEAMFSHLWRALALPGAEVRLVFHPPLPDEARHDRKRLANLAQSAVRHGVGQLWEEGDEYAGKSAAEQKKGAITAPFSDRTCVATSAAFCYGSITKARGAATQPDI